MMTYHRFDVAWLLSRVFMVIMMTYNKFDVAWLLPSVSLVCRRLLPTTAGALQRGAWSRSLSFGNLVFFPPFFFRRVDASDGWRRTVFAFFCHRRHLPPSSLPLWPCAVRPVRLITVNVLHIVWCFFFFFFTLFSRFACCTVCWGSSWWLCAVSIMLMVCIFLAAFFFFFLV